MSFVIYFDIPETPIDTGKEQPCATVSRTSFDGGNDAGDRQNNKREILHEREPPVTSLDDLC